MLHELWLTTIAELTMTESLKELFKSMVWHGCKLRVTGAANPQQIAIEGILIEHSASFVHLATQSQMRGLEGEKQQGPFARVFHIPKKGSTFQCLIIDKGRQTRQLTVDGSQM